MEKEKTVMQLQAKQCPSKFDSVSVKAAGSTTAVLY